MPPSIKPKVGNDGQGQVYSDVPFSLPSQKDSGSLPNHPPKAMDQVVEGVVQVIKAPVELLSGVAKWFAPSSEENKTAEVHRYEADQLFAEKKYTKAAKEYQLAIETSSVGGFARIGLWMLETQMGLGQCYFHLGDYSKASQIYGKILEKDSRDLDVRRLRLETNQELMKEIDPKKGRKFLEKIQQEILDDQAMILAINADEAKEDLVKIDKVLEKFHGFSLDEKKEKLNVLSLLSQHHLELASQKYPKNKDTEFVRNQLNGLASQGFLILSKFAETDSDPEIKKLSSLYKGYGLLADGKVDEGVKAFESIRATVPEADAILKNMDNDGLRAANLAALDVWAVRNAEGEKVIEAANDSVNGIITGTIDYWTRSDGKTIHHDNYEGTRLENNLVAALRMKITKGEATTIQEALQKIQESGPQELREKAKLYLVHSQNSQGSDNTMGILIAYCSKLPPDPAIARHLLDNTFHYEATQNAIETSYSLYAILNALSPEAEIKTKTKEHMEALSGNSSVARSVAKFWETTSFTEVLVDVAMMRGFAMVENLARLAMLEKLSEAGVTGYKAIGIACGVGTVVEGNYLFAWNTLKAAMNEDVKQVFSLKHLAKSYGATLVMLGLTKGFSAVGNATAAPVAKGLGMVVEGQLTTGGKVLSAIIGHTAGLGGMITSTKVNQALHLQEKTLGGWKESLTHDVLGYVQFAIAHQGVDKVTDGKLAHIEHGQHTKIAIREATLKAQALADRLGHKAEKGADGKWIESEERQRLVGILVEASLHQVGFSGSKLVDLISSKKFAEANQYLSKNKFPLTVGNDGTLHQVEYRPTFHETLAQEAIANAKVQPVKTVLGKGASPQKPLSPEAMAANERTTTQGLTLAAAAGVAAVVTLPSKKAQAESAHTETSKSKPLHAEVGHVAPRSPSETGTQFMIDGGFLAAGVAVAFFMRRTGEIFGRYHRGIGPIDVPKTEKHHSVMPGLGALAAIFAGVAWVMKTNPAVHSTVMKYANQAEAAMRGMKKITPKAVEKKAQKPISKESLIDQQEGGLPAKNYVPGLAREFGITDAGFPKSLNGALDFSHVSVGDAREIFRVLLPFVKDPEVRKGYFQKILRGDMTLDEAHELVENLQNPEVVTSPAAPIDFPLAAKGRPSETKSLFKTPEQIPHTSIFGTKKPTFLTPPREALVEACHSIMPGLEVLAAGLAFFGLTKTGRDFVTRAGKALENFLHTPDVPNEKPKASGKGAYYPLGEKIEALVKKAGKGAKEWLATKGPAVLDKILKAITVHPKIDEWVVRARLVAVDFKVWWKQKGQELFGKMLKNKPAAASETETPWARIVPSDGRLPRFYVPEVEAFPYDGPSPRRPLSPVILEALERAKAAEANDPLNQIPKETKPPSDASSEDPFEGPKTEEDLPPTLRIDISMAAKVSLAEALSSEPSLKALVHDRGFGKDAELMKIAETSKVDLQDAEVAFDHVNKGLRHTNKGLTPDELASARREVMKLILEGKINEVSAKKFEETCHKWSTPQNESEKNLGKAFKEALDKALGRDLSKKEVLELEGRLGIPKSDWIFKILQDPQEFFARHLAINCSEGVVHRLLANISKEDIEIGEDGTVLKGHDLIQSSLNEIAGVQQKIEKTLGVAKVKIPLSSVESLIQIALIAQHGKKLGIVGDPMDSYVAPEGGISHFDFTRLLATLYLRNAPPLISKERLEKISTLSDPALRRAEFLKALLQRETVTPPKATGKADLVDFTQEVDFLAAGETPFAAAARQLKAGKISVETYHALQADVAKTLVEGHFPAFAQVKTFLEGLQKIQSSLHIISTEGRMKNPSDLIAKLIRRAWTDHAPLTDIGGVRVVVKTNADAKAVVAKIREYFPIRELYSKDGAMELDVIGDHYYYSDFDKVEVVELGAKFDMDDTHRLVHGHPESGYRALHVVVDVGGVPVEIQIKTEAMAEWGVIQHKLVYKNNDLPEHLLRPIKLFCKQAADYLDHATHLQAGEKLESAPKPPILPFEIPSKIRAEMQKGIQAMVGLMKRYTPLQAQGSTFHLSN